MRLCDLLIGLGKFTVTVGTITAIFSVYSIIWDPSVTSMQFFFTGVATTFIGMFLIFVGEEVI